MQGKLQITGYLGEYLLGVVPCLEAKHLCSGACPSIVFEKIIHTAEFIEWKANII